MSNSSSHLVAGTRTQVMIFTGLGDHTWQMTRLPSQQLAKAGLCFFFLFRRLVKKVFGPRKYFYSLFSWRFFTGFYHGRSLLNHHVFVFFPSTLLQANLRRPSGLLILMFFFFFFRSLLFGGHLNGEAAVG